MIIFYLIFSHLVGDFVFQTNKLVAYKRKSDFGILIHAIIHFFTMLIVVLPFIINNHLYLIGIIGAICFIHFWIDFLKIRSKLKGKAKIYGFFIDQMGHFMVIFLFYFFFLKNIDFTLPQGVFYDFYSNSRIVFTFLGLAGFFTIYKGITSFKDFYELE